MRYIRSLIKIQQLPHQLLRTWTKTRCFQDKVLYDGQDLHLYTDTVSIYILTSHRFHFIFKFSADPVPILLSVLREDQSWAPPILARTPGFKNNESDYIKGTQRKPALLYKYFL